MVRIIKTEFYKLKRYHILWAGVALMLLSVLLTLFTSMANDGSVWDFEYLTEQVIKNNMSMIFPMCISLIAGYMISREQTDDTLKNILTVPVSLTLIETTGEYKNTIKLPDGGNYIGIECENFTGNIKLEIE